MNNILRKNSVFSLVQAILNIALIFFTIPIFIKLLGDELYGIFALIMVAGNLNTFTSLGLTNALVKFIAEQGRSEESNTDIIVNIVIMLGITSPVTLLILIWNKFVLINVLNIPPIHYQQAKWLFIWLLLSNLILLIGQSFKSILDALQKVYITSIQQILYNFSYWGLILISLIMGYRLAEIGFSIFLSSIFWFIITFYSAKKNWGPFTRDRNINHYLRSGKKQLHFSLKLYSGALIGFFYEPLSKILISNFIGVSAVAYYDIATKIKGQIVGVISKIFYPLFPFISEEKDVKKIRNFIHEIENKTFILIIPLISLTILLMDPFINFWLKENNTFIINSTIFLVISYLLGSATVIPFYHFMVAKNLVSKTIYIQLSNVIFNLLAFFLLFSSFGFYAIIIGNVIGITSSFLLSLYYQHKYLNSLIFNSLSQFFKFLISLISITTVGYIMKSILNIHQYWPNLIIILTVFLLTVIHYREYGFIRKSDVTKYLGNNRFTIWISHFFK